MGRPRSSHPPPFPEIGVGLQLVDDLLKPFAVDARVSVVLFTPTQGDGVGFELWRVVLHDHGVDSASCFQCRRCPLLGGRPGNVPHGGGHKTPGRARGRKNRSQAGYAYLHNAVDNQSCLAYTEILADETKETAVGFWQRSHTYFASVGIGVERVLTDKGSCYRSHAWRDFLVVRGVKHERTRP